LAVGTAATNPSM